MQDSIEKPRNGCNLQGAVQTLAEIKGIIPILHSTPGCGIQNYIANRASSASCGYLSGNEIPNSNVFEKQVIFGGTSRLREQIKNTVKVMKGDLYVVISGCEAEMVGDDILSMTQEIVDQGEKAIYYRAPGFKGNQYLGYEGVLDALITQLPKVTLPDAKPQKDLVNILGILPRQDIRWRGNLQEIERILSNLELKVNTLFGYGKGLSGWRNISGAALNIVVSKWGIRAAKRLQEIYGTPYLVIEDTGLQESTIRDYVRKIAHQLDLDDSKVETYLKQEKDQYIYALQQLSPRFFEYDFQKSVAIVGDESTVIRYAGFLSHIFGMEIEMVIVTDYIGKAEEQPISESLQKLSKEVYYSNDSSVIHKLLTNSTIDLILGSGLENGAAKELNIPNYIISYPAYGKTIFNRSDIGYTGAIQVIEELSDLIINHQY